MPRFHPAQALCLAALLIGIVCGGAHLRVGAPDPARWPAGWQFVGGQARIDGVAVGDEAEARFRVQAKRPGETVRVETTGGSADVPVVPAYGPPHMVVTFVIAFCFWAVCFFIFAARFDTEPARTFLWASLGYGLAVIAGDVHLPRLGSPGTFVGTFVRMAELLGTPVVFLRIAFIFPRPDPRLRGDRIVLAAAGVAAVLFVVEASALLTYVVAPARAAYERFVTAERVASGFLALLVLSGSAYLATSTRRAVLARERQQVKWVAWGSMVGAFPYGLLYALPKALGSPPLVPIELARLCAGIVPISYGIAVARHQFMDIDVIIRRSLLYGTMAALLTLTYIAVAVVLGGRTGPATLDGADALRLLTAGAAVALFTPTRRILGHWIDRVFFKLRTDHGERAARLHAELASAAEPADLAARVEDCVRDSLEPTRVEVRLAADTGLPSPNGGLHALVGATSRPEIEVEPARWPPALAAEGFVLARPLAADGGPVGVLLLGPRLSGRRYVEEDLAFLARVGEDAGRALDRLNLVRRAAAESLLRAQQEDLDRRKAEFLSQVAHDLRTPLTSILWSAQNVLDGISGPVPEAANENVRAIRSAAGHLGRLVNNLLEITRLEADGNIGPLERVAVEPAVAEALATLGPIARAWNVTIRLDAEPGLAPVRARREGLARIVVNLVENAIKYSPAGAEVEVTLRRDGPGRISLAVRDHGPGVSPDERDAVFERFHQGRIKAPRPAVAGTGGPDATAGPGLGLGLAVVRAWMDHCGGTVTIEAPEDGGARFTCRFVDDPLTPGGR